MHNDNYSRRQLTEDVGAFSRGLIMGVIIASLFFLVVVLAVDEAGRDSYPAPDDDAQQVEVTECLNG